MRSVPRSVAPVDPLLDRELEELGCGALLVVATSSHDPDLAPFVGCAHLGRSFLLAPQGGPARLGFDSPMEREEAASTGLSLLDPESLGLPRLAGNLQDPALRLAAELERAFELIGSINGRVALAGHAPVGEVHAACRHLEDRGFRFVSGHELVLRLRKRKGSAALAEIRNSAAGVVAAFRRLAAWLAAAVPRQGELWLEGERLTVARLRSEVARMVAGFGLEQPEGNLIAPAEEGAVPHNAGTDGRVLRGGESLVVDLFPRGRLFADCTRTFCVGEAPEALRRGHGTVLAALEAAHRQVRPGMRAWELQAAACELIGAQGYPTLLSDPETRVGYVHNLGHGVGWELHEYPSFRKATGSEGLLEEGDVLTLEPGLYDPPAGWAVRLEDLVHLGPSGPETLTPLPYALDPRAWT